MSCKMVDALIDANPESYTWYTLNSPFRSEPGPNTHPSASDDPVCRIAREHRLKDLPKPNLSGVLAVVQQKARERATAERQAKKSVSVR